MSFAVISHDSENQKVDEKTEKKERRREGDRERDRERDRESRSYTVDSHSTNQSTAPTWE